MRSGMKLGDIKSGSPFILALGGTTRPNSTSEKMLRLCCERVTALGADVTIIPGPGLVMPMYDPNKGERTAASTRLVELMRRADGFIIASPGYHGSISGLVKNALDYTEDLRDDQRPYFDGCRVGCIAVAQGWQAAVSTLGALRSISHALRGWPTPIGVAANATELEFDADGSCRNESVLRSIEIMSEQIVESRRYRVGNVWDIRESA